MKHYESISEYNDVLYESKPVALNDYLSDKYNIVHNELYNDALDKYLKELLSSYVNGKLLYNLFKYLSGYTSEKQMLNDIINLNDGNYIMNMISNYELSTDVLSPIFDLIVEYLNNIKNLIIKNVKFEHIDLVNNISEIIKLTLGDISDFRISIEDSVLLISEDGEDFIESEINDDNSFFILLENEYGILNIGFNSNGEMKIEIKAEEYFYKNLDAAEISNTIMKTNNESLLDEIMNIIMKYYKKSHRIIEIKNTEYWMASDIIIFNNKLPYHKTRVSLENYWNYYQKHDEYDISYIKMSKENNISDSEVSEIDYVKGKAGMHAKIANMDYNVPFKYLNERSKLSDEISLQNTFTINL